MAEEMCEPPEMTEFRELVKPLVEYLQKNYDPYHYIMISYNHADLVSLKMGVPFEDPRD